MTPETVERREKLLTLLKARAGPNAWLTTKEILELTGMRYTEVYPNLLAIARAGKLIHWPAYKLCPVEDEVFTATLMHGVDNNARWRYIAVSDPAPTHDVDLLEEWLAS